MVKNGMSINNFVFSCPRDGRNLKVQGYECSPPSPNINSAIVLVHGLHSYFTAEYCSSLKYDDNTKTYYLCEFDKENSWVGNLIDDIDSDIGIYGLDLESHGQSHGWENGRGIVKQFSDFSESIFHLLQEILNRNNVKEEHKNDFKFYLVGISMGGLIVTDFLRYLYLRKKEKKNKKINSNSGNLLDENTFYPSFHPNVVGTTLLAPALSVEKVKSKPINKFLLPLSNLVNKIAPHAKLVTIEDTHPLYPNIVDKSHPLHINGNGTVRLACEIMKTCEELQKDYFQNIGTHIQDFQLLVIHALNDEFTDPDGSKELIEKSNCKNKNAIYLSENSGFWHFLTREPETINEVYKKFVQHAKEVMKQ